MSYSGERVWLVGASDGIGAALARELDRRGAALLLSARNEQALDLLAADLKNAEVLALDIADIERISNVVRQLEGTGRVPDRIILMAAVYRPMRIGQIEPDALRQMLDVNLYGSILFCQAVLPLLQGHRGQLAVCGSVAAYTGLPGGQPYSATKAGLRNFTESLRAELQGDVDVRLISPGFVRTRMTDQNDFDMPMRMEPPAAAQAIADGLLRSGFEVHFPRPFTLSLKLLAMLPNRLKFWLTSRFNRTGGG